MTNATTDEPDEPQQNDLWVLLYEGEKDTRFAIGRVLNERLDVDRELLNERYDGQRLYVAEILYDAYEGLETPFTMKVVPESVFYARLPDHDEWDAQYEDLLNYMGGYLTRKDMADILDGEPSYMTNGERGYDAARFFYLDGLFESITEWSVHQGHGASAYGGSVHNRIHDIPEWMQEEALEQELERWTGGFELGDDAAAKLVELRLLQQELLDHDNEEEIRELVAEYDLEYDDYRDEEVSA